MRELKTEEVQIVTGGLGTGGLGIRQMIEDAFPGGEWDGPRYYPNGKPKAPYNGPYTT